MQLNSPGSAGLALITAVFIACALAARGQDPINEAPLPSSTDYTVAQTNAAPPLPSSPYAVDTYNSKGGAPVGENVLSGEPRRFYYHFGLTVGGFTTTTSLSVIRIGYPITISRL